MKGVIAIHFVGAFHEPNPTIGGIVDQIEKIHELTGSTKNIALGPDYLAAEADWNGTPASWVRGGGFRDDMVVNITAEMVSRGWKPEEIRDVLGWNLIELYGSVWSGKSREAIRPQLGRGE